MERERERERYREKERQREIIDPVHPVWALTGDQALPLGVFLDWRSNLEPFGAQDGAPTKPLG